MNRIFKCFIVCSFVVVSLSGCNDRAKNASMKANITSRAFVQKMNNGETTREQEQSYIRAVADLVFELDRNLRGTEKAENTKKLAAIISNGIDPNTPMKLFKENNTVESGN